MSLPVFETEWAKKEAQGYQYGRAALEGVRFGFKMAIDVVGADIARLEWMQFHGAKVCWGNDGEYCCVEWSGEEDSHRTILFTDWRQAIDAAKESGK